MINIDFNKKLTKYLLKASNQTPENLTSKLRLDWLLDQDRPVGCIYHSIFNHMVYIISKNDDEYKLIILDKKEEKPHNFVIESIEELLNYIRVDELCIDGTSNNMSNLLKEYISFPPNGMVMIQDDKLFLFDIYKEDENENA